MSGSPKAAEIRLQRARERQLEEERRRRAQEERRLREEAERQARLARIGQLRGMLDHESDQLEGAIAELHAMTPSSGNRRKADSFKSELNAARRAGDTPEALAASLGQVRAMAESVASLRRIAQLRGTLEHEAAELDAAVAELRAETQASGAQWAVDHVEPELEAMRRAADSPAALAASLDAVRAMAASLASQREYVAQGAAALAAEQDEIRREAEHEVRRLAEAERARTAERHRLVVLATTELRARIVGMEADEVTMAWSSAEVNAVSAAIGDIDAAADPSTTVRELHARLDAALENAQVRQLAEERRAFIVASLQDGLRQQGFQVGDPVLVGEGEGEVAFRASRADRRRVEVNVPLQGHVFYDVDDGDRITERGIDGLHYTSCDETEVRLEALHADLAERFGIQAGELFWESKDPNREQRNANALPSGGPATTRTRG